MARVNAPKLVGETLNLTFNFQRMVRFGESIGSPSFFVSVISGEDLNPDLMVNGAASVSGYEVTQSITGGMAGVVYSIECQVLGSDGTEYSQVTTLAVLSDYGSFGPTALPSLDGVLPDGVVGAAYSAPLSISGGYLPYSAYGIASGVAPVWMNFLVSGDTLTCFGTPIGTAAEAPLNYSFAPQIRDAALNTANAAQTITITRFVLSGNLPSGTVGASGTYQYTGSLGTPPYGNFSISAGALPDGASIDSSGLVSYTYTTAGDFSWTVRAEDANGVVSFLDDSNTVSEPIDIRARLYTLAYSADQDTIIVSGFPYGWKSVDRGASFQQIPSDSNAPVYRMVWSTSAQRYIGISSSGKFTSSATGAAPWTAIDPPVTWDSFPQNNDVAVSSSGRVVISTKTVSPIAVWSDDGINWNDCTYDGSGFTSNKPALYWDASTGFLAMFSNNNSGIYTSLTGSDFTQLRLTGNSISGSDTSIFAPGWTVPEYALFTDGGFASAIYQTYRVDDLFYTNRTGEIPIAYGQAIANLQRHLVIGGDVFCPVLTPPGGTADQPGFIMRVTNPATVTEDYVSELDFSAYPDHLDLPTDFIYLDFMDRLILIAELEQGVTWADYLTRIVVIDGVS